MINSYWFLKRNRICLKPALKKMKYVNVELIKNVCFYDTV